ncbi:PT domain-containing protein [Burkholderia vietnamiensis]|nr:PT domain-containing protein [Burkholderia vietnamiensis]MBR8052136.1 PT domain-containing protein [Burkholderia vietnamiensis]
MTAGTDRDGWDDRDDQRSRNRQPSNRPTVQPSNRPTVQPSNRPTVQPSNRPPTPAPNGSLAIPRPAAASRLALPIPRIFPPPDPRPFAAVLAQIARGFAQNRDHARNA